MAHKDYSTPKPDKWVTVGGTTKEGTKNPDKVTGYYLGSEEGPDKFNPGKTKHTHMLKTAEGITAVNSTTYMTRKISEATANFTAENGRPPVGAEVLIRYTGMQKLANGNTMKTYAVTFDADNTIEVANVTSNEADETYEDVDADDDQPTYDDTTYTAPVVTRAPTPKAPAALTAAELKAKKDEVFAKLKQRSK